jgi:hypothetical protein
MPAEVCPISVFRQGKWLSAGIACNSRETNAGHLSPHGQHDTQLLYKLIALKNNQIFSSSQKE